MKPILTITREFHFDAAHHLTNYYGKCENPHGHTYRLAVSVEGPIAEDGLVIDFVVLKQLVNDRVLEKLDHTDLNNIFENPSAENIAVWIWEQLADIGGLAKRDVKLVEVKLWEGQNTSVVYAGNRTKNFGDR